MATGYELDGEGPPPVTLTVGYYGQPDARQAGQLIEQVGRAYFTYARLVGYRGRLELSRVEIGSLFAEFAAILEGISAARRLPDHANLVQGFVRNLGVAVMLLSDATPIGLPPAIRDLLKMMTRPVQRREASNAQLTLRNADGTTLEINEANASAVRYAIDAVAGGRAHPMTTFGRDETGAIGFYPAKNDDDLLALGNTEQIAHLPNAKILSLTETLSSPSRGMSALLLQAGGRWYAETRETGELLLPVDDPRGRLSIYAAAERANALGELVYGHTGPQRFRVETVTPMLLGK